MPSTYGFEDKILEHNEVVQEHEFHLDGVDPTLKIKVLHMDGGGFMGVANLEVKGEGAGDYYRSHAIKASEEDAVRDALSGFFVFYSPEAEVREVKEW